MKTHLMGWLTSYGATAVVMLAIDMIWLGYIAKPWYQAGIGHLMSPAPNWAAVAVFYTMFPVGLMLFAVIPQAATEGFLKVALWGAAFGFFTFATYDLTNLAILKNYPLQLAVIDMAWGTCVSAVAAIAGKAVFNRFN